MQSDVEKLCRKLRPVLGKKIDMLYLKYTLTDKKEARIEIEQMLNALYQKHLNESLLNEAVFLEPPKSEVINGEYPLANISYAEKDVCQFGLRENDWQRHVCISEMSGSGKTTFAFQILQNFIKKNKPFLVFDWKKSFRPLMLTDENILCFTVGNKKVSNLFKININEPPNNIDHKEWLNLLCDIITECFSASYGVHKLLSEALDRAFIDFGVYEGSGNYPTWYQIRDRLEEKSQKARGRTRESEWLISALRIAHVLTFGNFGDAINTKKGNLRIDDLMDKKVIFELDALSNIEKKFFCSFLLTYIYKMKKASGAISEDFRNAILVDEAHNIFLKERPHFINESVTDVIYREIREYGVSLICLDQHISKLSDTVAGNSACNIAFQQMLPQDIECVAGIMQLKDRKNYFSMLPVGTAIVRLTERYYSPFLIKAPFTELKKKVVDDSFIAERMNYLTNTKLKKEDLKKEMEDMEFIFKESGVKDVDESFLKKQIELKKNEELLKKPIMNHLQVYLVKYIKEQLMLGFDLDVVKQHLLKYGYNRADIYRAITHIKEPHALYSLNKQQQKFLEFIQDYPHMGTAEIYRLLNLSGRLGNKIKNELVGIGLVEVKEERNGNGRKKVLQLSESARKTLEKAE